MYCIKKKKISVAKLVPSMQACAKLALKMFFKEISTTFMRVENIIIIYLTIEDTCQYAVNIIDY